jgi:glycosyltransferase involved in cell wall biosynthesis
MSDERTPLVSIAIPAYRPGPVFADTLRSCLAQDWANLEIVITLDEDDPAVDDAVARANDPRVRVLVNPERLGQFGNFNRAVGECRGKYVKLLCADDLLARDAVSVMARALEASPEVGLCAARMFAFWSDSRGRVAPRLGIPSPGTLAVRTFDAPSGRWFTAWHGNVVGGPSNVMLRRSEWWRTGGFDPRMDHCGEQGLWFRMISRSGVLLIDRPLIGYRIHENSVTGRGALSLDRIDQPFMMGETATLGAAFPNNAWWERLARTFQTVNSTTGYAASMITRNPLLGARGAWRVLTSGGLFGVPVMALLAGWALVRSSVLRLRTRWPFPDDDVEHHVSTGELDASAIVDLLSDPTARERLLSGSAR